MAFIPQGGGGGGSLNVETLISQTNTTYTTKSLKKGDILLLVCYGASNTPVPSNATLVLSETTGSPNRTFAYRIDADGTSTITGANNYYRVIRFYTE